MPPTGGTGIKPTLSDDPLEERTPRGRRLGGASKSVHRCNAWGLYKSGRHPSEGARGFERPKGTGRPGSSDFLGRWTKRATLNGSSASSEHNPYQPGLKTVSKTRHGPKFWQRSVNTETQKSVKSPVSWWCPRSRTGSEKPAGRGHC